MVLGTCPPVVTNIMSSVTYQALGGTVVTTTISVTAITTVPQTSPLKVVLPLGNTFTLLHGQTNTISVLGLDPDDVDAPESSITYAWQCVFVDSSPCLLGSGSPFPLPATSSRSFTVAASQAVQAKIHKISVTLSKPGKAPLTVQLTVDFDKLAVLPVAPGVWGNSGQKGGWIKEDDVYVLQACSDGRDGTICKLGGPQLGLQVTTRAFAAGKLLRSEDVV